MADNDVIISFFARQTDLLTGIDKQQSALLKLQNEWGKVGRRAKGAGDDIGNTFDKSSAGVMQLAGSLVGLGSAAGAAMTLLNQAKAEIENWRSRQTDAGNKQVEITALHRKAFLNLGEDKVIDSAEKMVSEFDKMAERTGALPATIAKMASSAYSARGGMSATEANAAVEATIRLMPDAGDSNLNAMAGSALDLGKMTGESPENVLGFLTSVSRASRVNDNEDIAQYVAPGIVSIMQHGASAKTAGALTAAMSSGEVDIHGRVSTGAARELDSQLAERLPLLKDVDERLAAVQKDRNLYKKLYEGGTFMVKDRASGKMVPKKFEPIHFENRADAAIEGLMSPDANNPFRKEYEAAKVNTLDIKKGKEVYDKQIADFEKLPGAKNAKIARDLDSLDDQIKLAETGDGLTGILRDKLKKIGKSSGSSDLAQTLDAWSFDLSNEDSRKAGAEQLRSISESRKNSIFESEFAKLNDGKFMPTDEDFDEAKKRAGSDVVAQKLDKIADLLAKMGDRPIKLVADPGVRPRKAAEGLGAGVRGVP